ncbi:inositol-trisphosphate 3-kinase A-like isoform X1 [Argonauta hians]
MVSKPSLNIEGSCCSDCVSPTPLCQMSSQVVDEAAYSKKCGHGSEQVPHDGIEITHNGDLETDQSCNAEDNSKVSHPNKRKSRTSSFLKWLSKKFHISSKRIEEDLDRGPPDRNARTSLAIKNESFQKASSTGNLYSDSVNCYFGEFSDNVNINKSEHRKSVALEPVLLSYKSRHLLDFEDHNLRNFSSCGTLEMCHDNSMMSCHNQVDTSSNNTGLPQSNDNLSSLPSPNPAVTAVTLPEEETAVEMLPCELTAVSISESRKMARTEKCIKFLSEHDFNEQSKSVSNAQTESRMQLSVSPVLSKYPSSSSPIGSLCSTECDSAIDVLSPDEEWPELKATPTESSSPSTSKDHLLSHKNTNCTPPTVIVTYHDDPCNEPVEVCQPTGYSGHLSTLSPPRKLSDCSMISDISDYSTESSVEEMPSAKYHWKKLRNAVTWNPFLQQLKKKKYPWIQLAGHQGCFQAGEKGTILKKLNTNEQKCYCVLQDDNLTAFIPSSYGEVVKENGEKFLQLEDLLSAFESPCVMDVKMGIRTYLEDELKKARENPKLRADMYEKMVDIDPTAPTTEEKEAQAISKPRYMQWRENISSSSSLGFRIEGVKKANGVSSKDFKRTRSPEDVQAAFLDFVNHDKNILLQYITRLKEIKPAVETSKLFKGHEVIGSSLLFIHSSCGKTGVWLIDFGKTTPLPNGIVTNHRNKWVEGNHEDGYLFGLDNLISLMEQLLL